MAKPKAPVKKFRIGMVEAAIWQNDDWYSVTISRSYKDGEDYKSTDSFGHGDLMNVIKVSQRAEAWIAEQN